MLEFLGSALSGGLLGAVTTGAKMALNYKEKKLELEHELRMVDKQNEQIKLENEARERIVTLETESAENIAAEKSLQTAIEAEDNIKASRWVNNIRGMTRPFLTLLLVCLTAAIWFSTEDKTLEMKLAEEISLLCGVAISYWFGRKLV